MTVRTALVRLAKSGSGLVSVCVCVCGGGGGISESEAKTTHVRLELWRVPHNELHEVTCSFRKERLMPILDLW